MQAVMCGTQLAVSRAAAHAAYCYGHLRVGYVHLHLLQRAGHIEACGPEDERLFAGRGKSGADAYSVLFGYAYLNKLLRKRLDEVAQRSASGSV